MFGIIDLGVGNIQSVMNAFDYLGVNLQRISKPDQINQCNGLILPGVGSFGSVLDAIRASDLENSLRDYICNGGNALAICVGLQILCRESDESQGVPGLSIIDGAVKSLKDLGCGGKLPHVGFNQVNEINRISGETESLSEDYYFVHSYALSEANNVKSVSFTSYGGTSFISAVKIFNTIATQFHPEKSGLKGLDILKKFIECSRKD
jgi:imidazole glycerol phosphate synthase glutamine amidotransferase subunit